MNWTRIDNTTEATEIVGAGCFVRFFNHAVPVFAPGVSIKKDDKGNSLFASPICGTHISFMTDGTTSTMGWVGDAGEKLDAKIEALKHRGTAKVDKKKFGKLKVTKSKK